MIKEIKAAVTIPVMAKARIGHFVEAQILEAVGIDYIDESEVRGQARVLDQLCLGCATSCGKQPRFWVCCCQCGGMSNAAPRRLFRTSLPPTPAHAPDVLSMSALPPPPHRC